MSRVNSKRKGKVGELNAVKFLKSLGYADAMRSQQYNGKGDSDVVAPESLTGLHIEVKYGYPHDAFSVGTSLWYQSVEQARIDSRGGPWVVLWKTKGSRLWKMTCESVGLLVTVTGDSLSEMLNRWAT